MPNRAMNATPQHGDPEEQGLAALPPLENRQQVARRHVDERAGRKAEHGAQHRVRQAAEGETLASVTATPSDEDGQTAHPESRFGYRLVRVAEMRQGEARQGWVFEPVHEQKVGGDRHR